MSISNAYDLNGNLRFTTDGNGTVTEYIYDSLNRIYQSKITVSGIQQVTTNTYDKNNNLLTKTDWLGNTYTNQYDGLNRLIKETDPYGKVIRAYEYNDNHAQIRAYDGLGNVTIY
ncbi:MAG: RHS repeat protein, partial [Clostridiales bacterium]|nr:RHS repeat protein [Clostridiales bacterium]